MLEFAACLSYFRRQFLLDMRFMCFETYIMIHSESLFSSYLCRSIHTICCLCRSAQDILIPYSKIISRFLKLKSSVGKLNRDLRCFERIEGAALSRALEDRITPEIRITGQSRYTAREAQHRRRSSLPSKEAENSMLRVRPGESRIPS